MTEHYKVGGSCYPPYKEYGIVENAALKYNKEKWEKDGDGDGEEVPLSPPAARPVHADPQFTRGAHAHLPARSLPPSRCSRPSPRTVPSTVATGAGGSKKGKSDRKTTKGGGTEGVSTTRTWALKAQMSAAAKMDKPWLSWGPNEKNEPKPSGVKKDAKGETLVYNENKALIAAR